MEPGEAHGRLNSRSTTTPTVALVAGGGEGRRSPTQQSGTTWRRRETGEEAWGSGQVAPTEAADEANVSDCILLFGAFCNGNMGDVVQPISMEHLLSSVALPEQCFYYAHPIGEDPSRGFSIGQFFGRDESKVIALSPDSAWKVNKFKAFVIGGGGIFSDRHAPLFMDEFAEALTLPIIVMGVGASYHAKEYSTLLQKAVFVSGRDTPSVERFADILGNVASPAVAPDDVRLVRDPVLCDEALTDTTGACWRLSQGDQGQRLCFVLPAAKTATAILNHKHFKDNLVRRGDMLINVFPKHQAEIEQFKYPETVEEIVDPMGFAKLCSCKAIISTRFHGVILGLHMGVPTFGALHVASKNKVAELVIDAMSLPDQFFLINGNLTREVVDRQVDTVRRLYDEEGRRGAIHDRLSVFNQEFQAEARHMFDVVGIARQDPEPQVFAPHPQLVFDDIARQPQNGVQGSPADEGGAAASAALTAAGSSTPTMRPPLPNSPMNSGRGSIVTVFLLFAIAGLALLPSTVGGRGRGRNQGGSEGTAVKGDDERLLDEGGRASVGQFGVQKEVDARNGTSAPGVSPETSPLQRLLLGVQSTTKPSNVLFALNFILWIALAVAFSSYSKSYLRDTHDPVGLLALQGVSGAVVLFCLGRLGLLASDASSPSDASSKARSPSALPTPTITASRRETLAAVLHSGQAILTNFSLFVGGVAVTNALKAMEPVAAAVASYFLLGKRVAPGGMAALGIIVAGILLLTFKRAAGEATGIGGGGSRIISGRILVSAAFTMAAVSCNALRNVVIKKGDPIPPHRTLFTCSVAAGVIGVALILVRLMIRHMDELLLGGEDRLAEGGGSSFQHGSWVSMDGVNAALCFVGYNFASFNLLARLSPVGHAVGNSVKRVVMFASGIVLLGEVMTVRQLAGAGVALVGVGVYNVAGKLK